MKPSRQTVNTSISLPRDICHHARQAAFDDNRSLSSLISRLLRDHLMASGYLDPVGPPSARSGSTAQRAGRLVTSR